MPCRLHNVFWCILTASPFHHKMSQHSNIWLLGCMDQHLIALGIWKRELFLSEISWRTNIAKFAKYIEWSCPCEINSNSMSHPHLQYIRSCPKCLISPLQSQALHALGRNSGSLPPFSKGARRAIADTAYAVCFHVEGFRLPFKDWACSSW